MSHRFGSFSADFSSSIFDSPYMLHDLGILPARFKQENLWSVVTKNDQAHTSSRLSGVRSTGLFPKRYFPWKSQQAVIPDCVVYAVKVYKWALCSKSLEFSISLVLIRFSYYNKRLDFLYKLSVIVVVSYVCHQKFRQKLARGKTKLIPLHMPYDWPLCSDSLWDNSCKFVSPLLTAKSQMKALTCNLSFCRKGHYMNEEEKCQHFLVRVPAFVVYNKR